MGGMRPRNGERLLKGSKTRRYRNGVIMRRTERIYPDRVLVVIAIIPSWPRFSSRSLPRRGTRRGRPPASATTQAVGHGVMMYNQDWDEQFSVRSPAVTATPVGARHGSAALCHGAHIQPYVKNYGVYVCRAMRTRPASQTGLRQRLRPDAVYADGGCAPEHDAQEQATIFPLS